MRTGRFGRPELGWFKTKAVLDARLLPRPPVRLAPLPADASAAERETWQLVREVVEIRVARGRPPDEPLPLSAPWLASWNGSDVNVIRAGRRRLEARSFLWRAHTVHVGKPKPLQLWHVRREANE